MLSVETYSRPLIFVVSQPEPPGFAKAKTGSDIKHNKLKTHARRVIVRGILEHEYTDFFIVWKAITSETAYKYQFQSRHDNLGISEIFKINPIPSSDRPHPKNPNISPCRCATPMIFIC